MKPEDAARVVRNVTTENRGDPPERVTCVKEEGGERTFRCSVVDDGEHDLVKLTCQEPEGRDSEGRLDADCVSGPP